MKVGDYLICKKNYYKSSGIFVKPTFRKNNGYRIDNIIEPGFSGTSGWVGTAGTTGTPGTSGVGSSVSTQTVVSNVVTPTTTTPTTTTTSTYTTTVCQHTTYIIDGEYLYDWYIEKYFYSKQEERLIKLKRLKKNEKKI